MNKFPIEIIHEISKYLTFADKVNLKKSCLEINSKLEIVDFYNISFILARKLNTDILKNHLNITKLDASLGYQITDISFLTKLEKLDASNSTGLCQINQNMINGLNLITLKARNNVNITNVSHMTKLKKLDASGSCKITQNCLFN